MNNPINNNGRAQIAKIFSDILVKGVTLDDALLHYQATEDSFIKAHSYGLCRWFYQLSFVANQLLDKPLKDKDSDIYALILLGLHQIFHSTIKSYALVSETVEAVIALKKPWAKGLVNACLRKTLREKEVFFDIIKNDEAAYYSHSSWMIDHIKKSWPNNWKEILAANNQQAPMTLRVHEENRIHCVYLEIPVSVHDIPGFKEGRISVQDEASQYVAPLLQLKPRDRVLDACSAPGGKTGHMLEIEPNIQLTALDISEKRLEKVKENLVRLKLGKNVEFIAADACDTDKFLNKKLFDKILIDAPCSGTGVIRRHPDIKLLRRKSDLFSFQAQQKKLLQSLWAILKSGGLLLYTTCSIMPEENEVVMEEFLLNNFDASSKEIQLPIGLKQKHGWQCFPQINGHDGFYYCLLQKI